MLSKSAHFEQHFSLFKISWLREKRCIYISSKVLLFTKLAAFLRMWLSYLCGSSTPHEKHNNEGDAILNQHEQVYLWPLPEHDIKEYSRSQKQPREADQLQ